MFNLPNLSQLFATAKDKQTIAQPVPCQPRNLIVMTRPLRKSDLRNQEGKRDRNFDKLSRKNYKLKARLKNEKDMVYDKTVRISELEAALADGETSDLGEVQLLRYALESTEEEIKTKDQKLAIYEKFQGLEELQAKLASVEKIAQATHNKIALSTETEKELQSLRADYAAVQNALQINQAERVQFEMEKESYQKLQDQLTAVSSQLATTRSELSACKDDLFQLQPAVQVTDAEVVRDLDSLCKNVTDWIEGEVSRFENANPNEKSEILFSTDSWRNAGRFMRKYPDTGAHLAGFFIYHHLINELFADRFLLLGISREMTECLWSAQEVMAKGNPPKDSTSINTWRSETLTALSATREVTESKMLKLKKMTDTIIQALATTFPILFSDRASKDRFHVEVIVPAGDLATKFQTSTTKYIVRLPRDPFAKLKPVTVTHLTDWVCIDRMTSKRVKSSNSLTLNIQGNVGEIILPLEPSLVRIAATGERTIIRKQACMIELYHPLAKRQRTR